MLINRYEIFAALGLTIALLAGPAHSQGVLKACEGDIKKYCSAVKPGDGRLLACFYAHEDKISDSCDRAVGDVADQLDNFMDTIRAGWAACAGDIEKHCAKVAAGEGRIYNCLKTQRTSLKQACGKFVDEAVKKTSN